MNNINKLALAALIIAGFAAPVAYAEEMAKPDAMMMKPADDKMMMKKDNAMMMAEEKQVKFSKEEFAMAEKSGKPFLVAFHKKGCPLCIEQQKALNSVYKDSAAKDLKVLVVDYNNDTESLKNFNVGQQGTLILFEGNSEISRTMGSKEPSAILSQIKG